MSEPQDVTMGTTIGADGEVVEFPRYKVELAPAKPFLMPSFDDKIVEILPSEKANRKIRFDENILVQEIENRFAYAYPEDDDDDSYEIEIVEDDGDADFYLEIVDGEVFYVFETEDDISEEESEEEDDMEESDEEGEAPRHALQLPANLSAPDLDADDDDDEIRPARPAAPAQELHRPHKADDQLEPDDAPFETPAPAMPQQPVPLSPQTPSSVPDSEPDNIISPPTSPPQAEQPKLTSAVLDEANFHTPISPKKPSIGSAPSSCASAVVESMPEPVSPIARRLAPATPTTGIKSPAKSILKACPESPKKPPTPKKKKKKGEKKEKTYTKTYVRPEQFDGEHRVYSWEKPDWTKKQLRSTGKGDLLRNEGNLANPITFPKGQRVNEGLDEEEQEKVKMDREELLRRIMSGDASLPMINLPGYRGRQRKLKFSVSGVNIRDGADLAKPITMATTLRKRDDVNLIAKPEKLRATAIGSKLKAGESLAAPVTMATQQKKYEWEKPAWARKKDESPKQEEEKTGAAAAVPAIEQKIEKKKYEWEKPSWAAAKPLRKTGKGEVLEKGANLAQPITQLPDIAKQKEEQK